MDMLKFWLYRAHSTTLVLSAVVYVEVEHVWGHR